MKRKAARPPARKPPRPRQAGGDSLQSLQAAFRILDELSNARQPMGLTDLAAMLGELKPRVYRHLSTMKRLGVIFQDGRNGRYSLGGKLFSSGRGGARAIRPALCRSALSDETAGSDAADRAVVGSRQRRAHRSRVRGRPRPAFHFLAPRQPPALALFIAGPNSARLRGRGGAQSHSVASTRHIHRSIRSRTAAGSRRAWKPSGSDSSRRLSMRCASASRRFPPRCFATPAN